MSGVAAGDSAINGQAGATLLSSHLNAGRTVVRVCSDTSPGEGYAAVAPNLEDVYFSVLRSHASGDRQQAAA